VFSALLNVTDGRYREAVKRVAFVDELLQRLRPDGGYFGTVGIPLQAGRIFDDSDRHRLQVAVVAASVSERAWPGQDAVGQRFRLGRGDAPSIEVVGVVGDLRAESLTTNPTLDVYLPYWQSDMVLYSDQMSVVFRTVRDAPEDLSAIRTTIRETAPTLPLPAFRTMDDITTASLTQRLRNGLGSADGCGGDDARRSWDLWRRVARGGPAYE
jgi:hypothetical protein